MTRLTLYGGVNQIGGNKILLEDTDTSLFLDFGTSFGERGKYYEEYLKPRSAFGLLDPLTMGLLPPLRGLYRQDMECIKADLWDDFQQYPSFRDLRDKEINGVLVSHAHLDHTGYLSFLRPDIPVYATPLTALIAKSIQDSGRSDFESEVVYSTPRELKETGLLGTTNYKKCPSQQRPYSLFTPQPISQEAESFWEETPGGRALDSTPLGYASAVGKLKVECFPVDHSVPGACAFAVKTSVGWIGYTGDVRLHGANRKETELFLDLLAVLRPVALLCEGTRTESSGGPNYTEADVEDRAYEAIRSVSQLVIADFGPRNLSRLQTFARIARLTGRALVVLPRDAYLLKAANLVEPEIPSLGDMPELHLYDDPTISRQSWDYKIREEYVNKLMSPEYIHNHQDQCILCFSFYDVNDLPSIRPNLGSLYLYSSHEAFSEELELDFKRLRNWIEHFEMKSIGLPLPNTRNEYAPGEEGLHASGHASAEDLLRVVKKVNPELLIPIHTLNPQFFAEGLSDTDIQVEVPNKSPFTLTLN